MRINPNDTMAIVVDYQEKLMPVILDNEQIAKNAITLIKGLKELEVPIVVSEQYVKGLGSTIEPIKEALGNAPTYEKVTFSLWLTEDIKEAIKNTGRKNVIICGTEAHICVLQTAIDLLEEGYNVYMVEDCVGSRKLNDKKFGCERAILEGAFITTYEAVLYELTAKAGTEVFKAVSKLTK